MPSIIPETSLDLFSTCPPSSMLAHDVYLDHVIQVARWSEQYGCKGILVYTDNSLVDPWLVAQVIVRNTMALAPLVAVQPIYMHPYSVAKMVSTLGYLYARRTYLNMVAGGFKNDLIALHDTTPHDRRYDRLVEYVAIIKALLSGESAVNFAGDFYQVEKLFLKPPLAPNLMPGIFVSGSSAAGLAAAREMGATSVEYPQPAAAYGEDRPHDNRAAGIRVGIIAREDEAQAWTVARARFPEDRKGQMTHKLAMKISDSAWHHQLSRLDDRTRSEPSPYWLVPFQNYKTFCPYLVGSYACVATELARYIGIGYHTFILDVPPSEEELHHTTVAFEHALQMTGRVTGAQRPLSERSNL